LESVLRTKAKELQNLNGQIRDIGKILDAIKSEYKREAAVLEGLRQQTAKLESFVYNYKNNNEEYVKVIKSIEKKYRTLYQTKRLF
jgi:chromosome segregation ATPase